MSEVIFLLGAGASMDAGMPSVAELTRELRQRLRGHTRELFDEILKLDPAIEGNYEKFFDWVDLIRKARMYPYCKTFKTYIPNNLLSAATDIAVDVKHPICDILFERRNAPRYDSGYLASIGGFTPDRGRIKVFTLNYDLCVEDACRANGIDITTGFDPKTKRWNPSLFQGASPGINLYKLHGSLIWTIPDERAEPFESYLVERMLERSVRADSPELVLGPGSKLQPDDPFVTLYAEFHRALETARICVVIGCSLADDHIKKPLQTASRRGMTVIEVNPTPIPKKPLFEHRRIIEKTAKNAFESGCIREMVERLRGVR